MSPRKRWFWTAERLRMLVEILKKDLAEKDEQGWYFGPEGLQMRVHLHLISKNHELAQGHMTNGIGVLVFLGVIERGRPSTKKSDYKRRFYPEKTSEITDANVDRFRAYKASL